MSNDYKFEGWVGEDSSSVNGTLVWKDFEPKVWEETDVDIRITHSGVCGSDIHTLRSGWGSTIFPCVVGHEIVGVVVRVGSEAGNFKLGEVVGVGAQADSCQSRDGPCAACENNEENYCKNRINTYDSIHRNGSVAYGGFALYHRCPGHFVIKIPPGIAPEHVAPMLCGGATVYLPLKRHGAGPGKTVGVIGIGGLGHFAILFAKAMGASKVVGISRRADKRADAISLGADEYIATSEDKDWASQNVGTLDIIISTISSAEIPIAEYLSLVALGGTLVQVGLPEEPLPVKASYLTKRRISITGSIIGSPSEIVEMLQLAAEKKVEPIVEIRPMKDANQAVTDMVLGKPRFRYVLVN